MENILVSIIIPVYKVEDYLRQCIDSVLEQNYKNKEIILVDDGSPDGSPEICDEYAEKYECVRVVHKENGGLSDARNFGLKQAKGEYVLFLDSDDYIEEGSLSKIMNSLEREKVDVVFLEAKKVFQDGTTQSLGDGITADAVRGKTQDEVLTYLSTCHKYPASACTKLLKKSLFDDGKLTFEKGLLSEDIDWSFKLFLKAKTYDYCDVDYYNYRKGREGSITNSVGSKHFSDMMYMLNKWNNESKKNFILSELAYEYAIMVANYGLLKCSDKKKFTRNMKRFVWLLSFRSGLRYTGIKLLCKIFGMRIAGIVTGTYLKMR